MICFLTWSLSFNPAILKVWPSDLWKSEIFSGVPMLKTIFFVNGTFFVIFFWVHKTQLTSPQEESRRWQETFPSQPVVRPLHVYCPGLGLIPGGETKMPQAAWQGQKKKEGGTYLSCWSLHWCHAPPVWYFVLVLYYEYPWWSSKKY